MKIIQSSSFTYPVKVLDEKCFTFFQPLVDYKFKILLFDRNSIEAGVFELLIDGAREMHACISTQVGCKFGCAMCASGKNGFIRNLTKEEILKQVEFLCDSVNISAFDHIVFMGIGEPLDNYDNFVASALELIRSNNFYAGRLSFATAGLPKKLLCLMQESIPAFQMLWISLHAPSDEKRVKIMPINRAFPIEEVLSAAKEFASNTPTNVWINYMLFRGFNDGIDDANELADLLFETESIFSVMITEPNNNLPLYSAANAFDLKIFEEYLLKAGVKNHTVCFTAAGKSVNAGCGEFILTRA